MAGREGGEEDRAQPGSGGPRRKLDAIQVAVASGAGGGREKKGEERERKRERERRKSGKKKKIREIHQQVEFKDNRRAPILKGLEAKYIRALTLEAYLGALLEEYFFTQTLKK